MLRSRDLGLRKEQNPLPYVFSPKQTSKSSALVFEIQVVGVSVSFKALWGKSGAWTKAKRTRVLGLLAKYHRNGTKTPN